MRAGAMCEGGCSGRGAHRVGCIQHLMRTALACSTVACVEAECDSGGAQQQEAPGRNSSITYILIKYNLGWEIGIPGAFARSRANRAQEDGVISSMAKSARKCLICDLSYDSWCAECCGYSASASAIALGYGACPRSSSMPVTRCRRVSMLAAGSVRAENDDARVPCCVVGQGMIWSME